MSSNKAKKLCENDNGTGNCNQGRCGWFRYWKPKSELLSCNCGVPIGSKEYVYEIGRYTKIGQDYGGNIDDIANKSLPYIRTKKTNWCGANAWSMSSYKKKDKKQITISDLLLQTNIIDPYKLESIDKVNKQKERTNIINGLNNKKVQELIKYMIKDNNYLYFTINDVELDHYHTIFNNNIKLSQEVNKLYKEITKKKDKVDISSTRSLYIKLTEELEKVINQSDKDFDKIKHSITKDKKKLIDTNQLYKRQIAYDIQSDNSRDNILKYVRYILYIIIFVLIILVIYNYIR